MLSGLGLFDYLLFAAPLWLVAVVLIVACVLFRELGSLLYRRVAARKAKEDADADADSAQSHIIGSIFGLLAFVIAFCFSIALDRYDNRRALVAEEANAIGTTYLRASLFDEPVRSQMQVTLREYAHSRLVPEGVWDAEMDRRLAKTRTLKDQLWEQTRAALYPIRDTEQASYFLDTMNHTIDTGTLRELAGRAQIPTRILDVMLLYLFASSAMLGYVLQGRKGNHRTASAIMLALFVLIITLVLDIDRPQEGSIRVPQRAMEELVAALDRDAARPALVAPVAGQ